MRLVSLSIAAACAAMVTSPSLAADPVADFYAGKIVTIYVGSSPGGTYDLGARLVAKYMGKYLAGAPTVLVKNMPGAGGLILASELYTGVLPQDGTAIGTFDRNAPMNEVLGLAKTDLKTAELNWIGSTSTDIGTCAVWHDTHITPQTFMTDEVVVGATPGAGTAMYPNILNNLLGTKLKMVSGYPGAVELSLAMEKGEIQGRCGWSWSSVSTEHDWLRDDKVTITLVLGSRKIAAIPDVPVSTDFAKTDYQRQVLELITSSQLMGRPFAAPPNVPKERIEALRTAFSATMQDPQLREDAAREQLEIDPTDGHALQKIVESFFTAPAEIRDGAKDAITRNAK
jgi:hypothetical protein